MTDRTYTRADVRLAIDRQNKTGKPVSWLTISRHWPEGIKDLTLEQVRDLIIVPWDRRGKECYCCCSLNDWHDAFCDACKIKIVIELKFMDRAGEAKDDSVEEIQPEPDYELDIAETKQ